MALISNNISGSSSNNSKIGITGSVVIANVPGASFPDQPGVDVVFFVSGSRGIGTNISSFGGDLKVSGTLYSLDGLDVRGSTIISGSGQVSIDSSGSTISIGGASATGAISVGTAGNRSITIGNITNTSPLILSGGTGGITLTTDAVNGNISVTNTLTGSLNLFNDAGAGTVNIVGSAATGTRTVNIATGGTGAKTVNIGNAFTAGSTVTINAGTTGGVNIATGGAAIPVNIATGFLNAGTVNIGTGAASQILNFGTGGISKTVSVGSPNGTGSLSLQAGTDGVNIATVAFATPVNIANNTVAGTVNIGTGSATQTLNFGTGMGVKTVTVGSRDTTSTTLINAGTGGVTVSSGSTTAASIGSDVFFYVSGNIATKPATSPNFAIRGTTVFGGDVVISGTLFGGSPLYIGDDVIIGKNQILGSSGGIAIAFTGSDVTIPNDLILSGNAYFGSGLTGSLTKLNDGSDYLRAGTNVQISTGSSGEVTISVPGSGGGDVVGPASATNDAIAVYSGATGKLIKNSNLLVGTITSTQAYVTASVSLTNYGLGLVPNGTGSLTSQIPDGTVTGGNARGGYAVDFQRNRSDVASVASGFQSFIGNGNNNTVSGIRSSITNGQSNIVSSNNSTIGGGANNTIAGAEYVFVNSQNSSATGNYGGILGGFSSTSSAFGAITLGGQYGVADHHTEVVISPNRFTTNGDAQQSLVTWLRQTTTAATTELTLTGAAPGSGTRFTIASGAKYTAQLGIVASSTAGDTAWWQLAFGIKNVGGTTSLVGSVVTVASAADAGASSWSVSVVADNTNDSIQINVTGAASTTINWVASGHLTKVAS